MIFELNTSFPFGINNNGDTGEESIQYHGQDLLAEKTLNVILNDISSRNEVRTSRVVVVITTAQLHSSKPEHRSCSGSNPARGVSEIRDGEDL